MDEIFLSASVPEKGRGNYYETADPLLIQAAIRAFIDVTLGRRKIVWGGHPTITPMILQACQELNIPYSESVTIYQSKFFEQEFPEENECFKNVVLIDTVNNDKTASLIKMREQMLSRNEIISAVFIGGMEGIEDEYNLIKKLNPLATILVVPSPGGAALDLAKKLGFDDEKLSSIDYFKIFHSGLQIRADELRANSSKRGAASPQRKPF